MIGPLGVDDAGELLTIQRAAYVGESMVYDQFLPPLRETLDEVARCWRATTSWCSGARRARLVGAVRVMPTGEVARCASCPTSRARASAPRCCAPRSRPAARGCSPASAATGNLRLYEKHGFVETRREPSVGHDLVFLELPSA